MTTSNTEVPILDSTNVDKLVNDISSRISFLSGHKKHYRRKYVGFSILVGGIASINAFIVGASQIYEIKVLGLVGFFTSSVVAFIGVVDGVLKPKEMWARNAETLNNLYDLRERIRYKTRRNGGLTLDELDTFADEYRRIEKDFFGNVVEIHSESKNNDHT